VPAEQARAAAERAELVALLVTEGLLDSPDAPEDAIVVAMHRMLGRSRCRLALVAPYDLVGEVRQPNLPGTVDEYPNWRLPLGASLEDLRHDSRIAAVLPLRD